MQLIPHSSPFLGKAEKTVLSGVLSSGQLVQGREVEKFEQEMADYIGVKGGVATNSGTAALHLALLSLGVKKGDEVILPSFVCSAPLLAILYSGAKPVFADINLSDYNLSCPDVRQKISSRSKAVILPHLFGFPADIGDFLKLGIPIIEDCAHSLGAEYQGEKVGSFGKIAICSFYATKLITTGEGGMVLSDSKKILDLVRDRRDYDQKKSFCLRYNYKMTELQAALGRIQLKRLPYFISQRKKIAQRYTQSLHPDQGISLPTKQENKTPVFYRYLIRVEKNSSWLLKQLNRQRIAARRPVFELLHRYLKKNISLPFSQEAFRKTVSLPIYPGLTEGEQKRIIAALQRCHLL